MIKINIVYTCGGQLHKLYENAKGEVWMSESRHPDMINVGMGYHSIREHAPEDCFLLLEPYCVSPEDYGVEFLKGFRKIFTWADRAVPEGIEVIKINHPSFYQIPPSAPTDWHHWNQRANEIAIIANNKQSNHYSQIYHLRVQLADLLHQHSNFRVAWYGENPGGKVYFKGRIESKHEVLKKVKFCICTENSYDEKYSHNYFTEKMPDVWMAGAVPLYMGCYNINDFNLFEHSYIDLRTYVTKVGTDLNVNLNPLLSRIHNFSEQQYNNYCDGVRAGLFANGKLNELVGFERAYDTIIDSLL